MPADLSDLIGAGTTVLGDTVIDAFADPAVQTAMARTSAAILADPAVKNELRRRSFEAGLLAGGLVFLGIWLGRRI